MNVVTVSQINRYLDFYLAEDKKLKDIYIKGEISNFSRNTLSGHVYFSLKDEESSIKVVMFSSNARNLSFEPQDGLGVIARGTVKLYAKDAFCQLVAVDLMPFGAGASHIQFEQLKKKLYEQGLFDPAHKKTLPSFPQTIGVITSQDSAAYRDLLNIISRRYQIAKIVLCPVTVQGATAPAEICEAFDRIEGHCDVVLLVRGGGSFEDLSAFNNEKLARRIFACTTPVVTGIGHETDYTLADFVSDVRAPTPSGAAELATPDLSITKNQLGACRTQLDQGLQKYFSEANICLQNYKQIFYNILKDNIGAKRARINGYDELLSRAAAQKLVVLSQSLKNKREMLEALGPVEVLRRGFSYTIKGESVLRSVKDIKPGDTVSTALSDGSFISTVQKISPQNHTGTEEA